MILCGTINEIPKSVNEIYRSTARGIRKTDEGKAFENRCHDVVSKALKARRFRPIPRAIGWQLDVVVWLPKLETDEWLKHGGEHDRFVRRDTDNFTKLAMDGVFRALGENDSSTVSLMVTKKDGKGEGWIDFVLREVSVPAEEPNNTEIAQAINERNTGIRASPGDPPGLLQSLHARADAKDDVRFTPFDAWRLEIMDQLTKILPDIQARVKCPARTGDLNACFDCSDMMVIHCIMCNPKALDEEGKVVGLFDLCQQRSGRYVGEVDRPEGGAMEGTATNKTVSAQLVEILSLLGKADKEQKLLSSALKLIYALLSGLPDKNAASAQEVCVKLAVVLADLIEAGAGKSLPKSILYYKDVNQSSMPDGLKKKLAKAGSAYQLCVELYGQYRQALVDWAATQEPAKKGKGKKAEAEEEPATEQTDAEGEQQAADAEEAAPQEAAEAPQEAQEEAPEAAEESDEPAAPEPVQDASIDAQPAEMPKVNDIPEDEKPKEDKPKTTKATKTKEPPPEKEQLQIPGTEGDGKPLDLAGEVRALRAQVADQSAKMKKIADAFNALREWLINKG